MKLLPAYAESLQDFIPLPKMTPQDVEWLRYHEAVTKALWQSMNITERRPFHELLRIQFQLDAIYRAQRKGQEEMYECRS